LITKVNRGTSAYERTLLN